MDGIRRFFRRGSASRPAEGGFTLVEMLVVITIIGLIMALVGPRVLNYLSESKVKAAKFKSKASRRRSTFSISTTAAIRPRRRVFQRWCSGRLAPCLWNGPYLKTASVPADPWGRPYRLSVAGGPCAL